jgi:hypothetical protein
VKIHRIGHEVRDGHVHTNLRVSGKHIAHELRYRSRDGQAVDEKETARHTALLDAADEAYPSFRAYEGQTFTVCHTDIEISDFKLRVWHPERVELYVRWTEESHGDKRVRKHQSFHSADRLPDPAAVLEIVRGEIRQRCRGIDGVKATVERLKEAHGLSKESGSLGGSIVR